MSPESLEEQAMMDPQGLIAYLDELYEQAVREDAVPWHDAGRRSLLEETFPWDGSEASAPRSVTDASIGHTPDPPGE